MYRNLLLSFVLFLLFLPCAYAQSPFLKLLRADSLFEAKKYTQSFEIYKNILETSNQFSPRMLLRMGFIKEGLGDYTSALYYLNLFYSFNSDKEVLKKMEEIASRYKLSGYNYTDLEYFISLYNEYYYYIITLFLMAAVSFYLYMIIRKTSKSRLGFSPLLFMIILSAAYYLSNYSLTPPKGILTNAHTPLMSSPSGGSYLIDYVGKGHRVTLLGKEDIWYKILWNDKPAYVREGNLVLIESSL
jgi:tetratricopeptide (TPR) repeat protein